MQGNVFGQSGGGFKIDELIEDYKVASGGNVNVGDFVKFIEEYNITEGTITNINSTKYYGWNISVVPLSNDKVFIAHSSGGPQSSYYLYGVICTINETNITAGVDTRLYNLTNCGRYYSIVRLTSDKVFIAYGTSLYVMICTINGTTITVESNTSLGTTFKSEVYCIELTSDKVFIAYNYSSNSSSYYLYGIVCTISGTTVTMGKYTGITSKFSPQKLEVKVLSSNKIFIIGNDDIFYYLYGVVCTIDGTTVTAGSTTVLSHSEISIPHVLQLSENKVFASYTHNTNSYIYGIVCTIDETTITKGTETQLSNISFNKRYANCEAVKLSNNKVFIVYTTSENKDFNGMICNIDNLAITIKVNNNLNVTSQGTSGDISMIILSNNKIFITYGYDSYTYLYGVICTIDETIGVKQLENLIDKLFGLANTSGTENEMVQVYVPNVQ